MSKPKTSLREPDIDNRLLDDRSATPERLRAAGLNGFVVSDSGIINFRSQQSPIERAVARGTISEQHGAAAEKFYRHWERGGSVSLLTNWKVELSPGGKIDHCHTASNDIYVNDRDQICRALDAIHRDMDRCGQSITATKMLFMVVCQEISIEDAALAIWPKWGASKRNNIGLDRLRSALRALTIEWNL